MKTRYILLAAMALFGFSCTSELEVEVQPQAGERVTIKVSTAESLGTKVTLSEAADRKAMNLEWEDGDIISVNGKEFEAVNIISSHEAEFDGEDPGEGPYTIIYPGKYADAAAFNARSYASQAQSGNSSTAHLEYNAMLSGVSDYEEPKFDAAWAVDNGGTLVQNGVIQLRLQVPADVTAVSSVTLLASREVFPTTNGGDVKAAEQTLSLSDVTLTDNRILEAYMMFSAAGVEFQDDDILTVIVETADAMYIRSLAMTAQTWAGGSQYTIQCKVLTENSFEINNVSDLELFRDGVNSGSMLWQRCHVTLKADLDCSVLSDWTPIGNGTFTGSNYSGNAFKGVFEGGNHVLKNFALSGKTPSDQGVFGFFGVLVNAVVKDLTFGAETGDSGVFTVSMTGGTGDAGVVAGAVIGSTLENITNYLPMTCNGSDTNNKRATCAMVGYVYGNKTFGMSTIDGLVNYGEMTHQWGSNTTVGAGGVHGAGIVGYINGSGTSTLRNYFHNCKNYGDMTSEIGRTAGIVGAIYAYTLIEGCENNGDQDNSCNNGRLGGITSIVQGMYSEMKDCVNNGDIIASGGTNTQLGGLACMLSKGSSDTEDGFVKVSGGGNHGRIIGDKIDKYHGTIIANFSAFASVSNVVAGGAYGTYNGGDYQYTVLTEDNYMNYIGTRAAANESKITNISFEAWDGYPEAGVTKISNAAELLAFAEAVNNGSFAATDKALLLNDIDCSSITDWTPIGAGSFSWVSNKLTISSGHPFEGTFDGNGKTIKNLDQAYTVSTAAGAYGFFGMVADGAVIKDLTFDSDCSLSVTASALGDFGVLAGLVQGATIKNITSYASISGGATNTLGTNRVTMGIIGFAFVNNAAASIQDVVNYGQITAVNGNNTNNGGNGVQVAGILGFGTNDASSTTTVNVTSCVNYGNMSGDVARLSGIVAACNRYTVVTDCVNYGNQINTATHSSKTRGGNISCISSTGSKYIRCINYGDIIANGTCQPGGVIGMPNHATNVIEGCENYGKVVAATGITNKGTLFGYCNNAASFKDCVASGDLGTYVDGVNDTMVGVNADNYSQYWGYKGANATNVTTSNITWKPVPTE